jgi:hypothetical protein
MHVTTCRLSISPDNTKLGRIPSISFSTSGCPLQCDYCYARNIERRYPTVARAWAGNAWYFREHPEAEIVETIQHEIAGARLFRWLVGGEFSDKSFEIARWLAAEMPAIQFMSYTKRAELGKIPRPPNFVLLLSWYDILEATTINAFVRAIDDLARDYGFDGSSIITPKLTTCKHQLVGMTCAECQTCFRGESLIIRLHH